jgi:hypothetical protein
VLRLMMGASIVAVYAALTASELWAERRRAMQRGWPAIRDSGPAWLRADAADLAGQLSAPQ